MNFKLTIRSLTELGNPIFVVLRSEATKDLGEVLRGLNARSFGRRKTLRMTAVYRPERSEVPVFLISSIFS
jgi:hypothetical protein